MRRPHVGHASFVIAFLACAVTLNAHVPDKFTSNLLSGNSVHQPDEKNRDLAEQEVVEKRRWMRACYLSPHLNVATLDAHLCTHLLFFAGTIDAQGLFNMSASNERRLHRVLLLKRQNPLLAVSVTVGASSDRFAAAASTETKRQAFSASVAAFLRRTGADGIDLDWEFPAFLRPFRERHHFTLLLASLRRELTRLRPRRLLSAAVGAPRELMQLSYEAAAVGQLVDFVSVMTYDFHLFSELTPATGHNAPLFASESDTGAAFAAMNTNASVHHWLASGVPRHKLLIGLPTYGRGYRLVNNQQHGLYSPALGPWKDGYVSLADACHLLKTGGTGVWDSFALVPYAYRDNLWFSYDNEVSLLAKATFVRSMKVAGAMTFDLIHDDWLNQCGNGAYPLHRVIRSVLP